MSEEHCYSNMVFTTSKNSLATDSRTTGQGTWSPALAPEKPEHRYQPQKWPIVFLNLTCALLLAGIIALFVCYYLSQSAAGQLKKDISALLETNQQLQVLMETNQQLQVLKINLTAQNGFLESENKQLLKNQTLLDEILQFRNFPVERYCPNGTTCSRCPTGWMFNNSKCYFLYLGPTLKTWQDSRIECFKMGADLLTIQDKQEQMFIMNLAPAYYDKWHGYWIGLSRQANNWVWVNGSSLTTGFWVDKQSKNYVLINTNLTTLNSWQTNDTDMFNRWICENKALLY